MTKTQATGNLEPMYRRNFVHFLTDNILFNLAMGIMGPTTVIPDFIRHLTSSEVLIGFLSSLFDVGWTLPQLFIARYLVRFERKKWWFVGPNIPVRFVMFTFGVVAILLGKDQPGPILIAFLICYGVAALGDGVVSVPWAVLVGTSLDGRWRARLYGLTTVCVGIIMLGVTQLIGYVLGRSGLAFPNNYAVIFGAAGLVFAISILPLAFLKELPGGKVAEKTPALGEFLPSLGQVLQTDHAYRAMLFARLLTTLFTMASPFYIGFATVKLGLSSTVAVPTLLAMQTVGSVSGALIYTWLGARNNLLFIRSTLGLAACLPLSALLATQVGPGPLYFGFLMLGLTQGNLFSSYQNWVITHATPDHRPVYVGLFNTIVAVVTLLAPFVAGTIVSSIGYEALFIVALAMVLGAMAVTVRFVPNTKPVEALASAAD